MGDLRHRVDRVREAWIAEAEAARGLLARIERLDYRDEEGGPRIRQVESALREYASAVSEAVGRLDVDDASPAANAAWDSVLAARRSAWEGIASALERAGGALERSQGAHAIDRMRLAEALYLLSRESREAVDFLARKAELDEQIRGLQRELAARDEQLAHARADADRLSGRVSTLEGELAGATGSLRAREEEVSHLRGEVARLESILAQDGHRFVTRLASALASYPRLVAMLSAVVRTLNRLLARIGR